MKLTYRYTEILMKVLFSAVILHLFGIALGAGEGCFSPLLVTEMLEYSAAGAMCACGGGLLLEYVAKREE